MERVFIKKGSCCVWIAVTEAGKLELNGQDFGGWSGTSEYEYSILVEPTDFGAIREALGGEPDADIVDLMCAHAATIFSAGERAWLQSLGIKVEFYNRFGFD